MNNLNSLLQFSSPEEIHNHTQPHLPSFDTPPSHHDFLDQMLSSVPSSASSFPWAADQPLTDQSASKMRQHQITNGAAAMLQHQLLLSRNLTAANDLRSPSGGADFGLLQEQQADHNDVVDGHSFNSAVPENDASIKALFNGFTGLLGQTSNQPQHFHLPQAEGFGVPAAAPVSGGGVGGQPKQRVRARRGQATDPHSIAERLRRERIAERMKGLQELVPNANKADKASMLDEIIDYVKFLQLQVKVLSMSRLGGAAAGAPLLGVTSCEGKSSSGAQTSSENNEGMMVAEQQVAKLMEEDLSAAMQYLQGKGLCLMPISLATAISTSTCGRSRNPIPPHNNLLLNGEAGGPTSPSISVLTVQSASVGGGELSLKDATSISKS